MDKRKLACDTCSHYGGGTQCNCAMPCYATNGKVRKGLTSRRNNKGRCKHHTERVRVYDHPMCGCALIPEVDDILTRVNEKLNEFKSKRHTKRINQEVILELGGNAYEQLKREALAMSGRAPAEANASESYRGYRIIRPNNVGADYVGFELIDKPQGTCLPMCDDWGTVLGKNPGCYHGLKEAIDGIKGHEIIWAAMNAKTELTIGQPCPHGKGYEIKKVEEVSK